MLDAFWLNPVSTFFFTRSFVKQGNNFGAGRGGGNKNKINKITKLFTTVEVHKKSGFIFTSVKTFAPPQIF